MSTELVPEVIGLVAAYLKSGPLVNGRIPDDVVHEGQADLARLLRVSKAVHEHCAPLLYQDCLIDNAIPLARAIKSNPTHPIRYARRLHLAHASPPDFPLYTYIFQSTAFDWTYVEVRTKPGPLEVVPSLSQVYELEGTTAMVNAVRKHPEAGTPMLPHLTRVVIRACDLAVQPALAGQWHKTIESSGSRHLLLLQLLDRPSVEHYCQTRLLGWLALDQCMIKVANPPAVITYHLPEDFVFSPPGQLAPVVLGTTNRYIFSSQIKVDWNTAGDQVLDPAGQISLILKGITDTLQLVDKVLFKADQGDGLSYNGLLADFPDAVRDTKIELYGAIPLDSEHGPTYCGAHGLDIRGQERDLSGSLTPAQKLLDEQLPAEWKGRVVLKHRDETPPCTACDLDCQRQWDTLPYLLELNAFVVDTH